MEAGKFLLDIWLGGIGVGAPSPYQPQYQPQYQPGQYAPPGYPPGYRPMVVPAGVGLPPPVALQAVPASPFGVAIVGVAPTTSGPAVASLVTGVGSILVSFVVICFGALGANSGWGPVVAGAFAVLAGLVGVAALVLSQLAFRQVRRAVDWGASKGRGVAIAGLICGAVGLLITVLGVVLAITLSLQTR
jgi:hypothetical protein